MKTATTHNDLKTKVLLFAISSRVFIIFLSWISNVVLPDHDAGVYIFPQPTTINISFADEIINNVFGGLVRWDAQYFLHIAHYGYTYENTLVFFPMFPFFARILANVLDVILNGVLNHYSTVLLSALTINFYFFVSASIKLFELSCKVLKDESLAYKSALFFCVNPASIFFTAPYSESCFAFFTFSGMLFCVENERDLLSSFALGLSSCARSNGVLNLGYIAHKCIKRAFNILQVLKYQFNFSSFYTMIVELCKLCICTIVFIAPFIMFQGYAYMTFCKSKVNIPEFLNEFGKSKGFVTPSSDSPPWCNHKIPFSYSYVQNHYWHVGFLKYYQIKQIPNFVLASPVIFLILRHSYLFMLENTSILFSLGLKSPYRVNYQQQELTPEFFVFVVHTVFLTIFCMFFVHVQVTTRMIASSCPVLYWFVALRYKTESGTKSDVISSRLKTSGSNNYSLVETKENIASVWRTVILTDKPVNIWSHCIRMYFYSYFIIGTVIFSNFLPWT
ncbi:GPI mannosyltransferase 2-like [Macrosteles quadrilineatus]|uniref:GPI mannosyltransferase 2-like n=1 Tax=Macrosteles quadrilineatus TaxID=74068 RepID=UPI0023E1F275|nr:GPI mannosyltransferase 2-like [Macrosteles quadrilineatus]